MPTTQALFPSSLQATGYRRFIFQCFQLPCYSLYNQVSLISALLQFADLAAVTVLICQALKVCCLDQVRKAYSTVRLLHYLALNRLCIRYSPGLQHIASLAGLSHTTLFVLTLREFTFRMCSCLWLRPTGR